MTATQRVVCPQVQAARTAAAAVRWVTRLPGVLAVRTQPETAELVLTYDLRKVTLADIRRHLQRGGVSCEGTLIQRCNLLAIDHAERAVRALHGLAASATTADVPFVRMGGAA